MPVINRVRFVNVTYDNRNIKDCIFDMYGGCDALMNLSNGGGKSVMVQLMFQPVIPGGVDRRQEYFQLSTEERYANTYNN